MRGLVANFIPAADDDGFLRNAESPEGKLYRRIVDEVGHFKGEFDPEKAHLINKQGIYTFTPSGVMLGSIYSNEAEEVAGMLKKALKKWEGLASGERLAEQAIDPAGATPRPEQGYPTDGLVLVESIRDLPRTPPQDPFYAGSWNKDYVWFRREEARKLLPKRLVAGVRQDVPRDLARRLAAYHFVDNVRNIDLPYNPEDVEKGRLTATVLGVDGDLVRIRMEGFARTSKSGRWPVNGAEDHDNPKEQTRGVDVTILGQATWDRKEEKFVAFELVAMGPRWGGTEWNGRADDLAGGPIGFAFKIAGNGPTDRMAPYALTWGKYW